MRALDLYLCVALCACMMQHDIVWGDMRLILVRMRTAAARVSACCYRARVLVVVLVFS